MTSMVRDQDGTSQMRRRPAGTALALVIAFMPMVVAAQSVRAQTLSVLYSFTGKHGDGAGPTGGLVRDSAGNLYGTTESGGVGNDGFGFGTVFKLSPGEDDTWSETVPYKFKGAPNETPEGGLTLDSAGNLYGITTFGGGGGTVFKVTKTGKGTVLYEFCSVADCADGSGPNGGLVQDAAGNLYGTTILGGSSAFCNGEGCGVVFKLTPTGQETVLYNFCSVANCADGAFPFGGGETFPDEELAQDAEGNLYGTTPIGGTSAFCDSSVGCGIVFKVTETGEETVLYNFCSQAKCVDGSDPATGLIQDGAGNLYGTTRDGGKHIHYGTVFKVDTTDSETVFYSFAGLASVGPPFPSSLVMDAAGNLYGTTEFGGTHHSGSVFEVTNSGRTRMLYSFTNGTDGGFPVGRLILDAAGNLYGTTTSGGDLSDCSGSGCGTVFELIP